MTGRDDWDAKAAWMREVDALEATFASDGTLMNVKLESCSAASSRDQSETPHASSGDASPPPAAPRLISRAGPRLIPRDHTDRK